MRRVTGVGARLLRDRAGRGRDPVAPAGGDARRRPRGRSDQRERRAGGRDGGGQRPARGVAAAAAGGDAAGRLPRLRVRAVQAPQPRVPLRRDALAVARRRRARGRAARPPAPHAGAASACRRPSSCSCPRSARCAPRAGRTSRRSWCRCRARTSRRCGARSPPSMPCWSIADDGGVGRLPVAAGHLAGADRAGAGGDAAGGRDGARRPRRRGELVLRRGPAAVRGARHACRVVVGAGSVGAAGAERSADGAGQPHAVPAAGRGVAGARRRHGDGALPRPRRLQDDQRPLGPRRRRRGAGRPPPGGSRRRCGRATSPRGWAATSSRCCSRTSTTTTASTSRRASSTCWRSRCVADGERVAVRASVGIATAAAGSIDAAGLLRRADLAMYRAKDAGQATSCASGSRRWSRSARARRRGATSWPRRSRPARWSALPADRVAGERRGRGGRGARALAPPAARAAGGGHVPARRLRRAGPRGRPRGARPGVLRPRLLARCRRST